LRSNANEIIAEKMVPVKGVKDAGVLYAASSKKVPIITTAKMTEKLKMSDAHAFRRTQYRYFGMVVKISIREFMLAPLIF
jgi:Asp/Glu/hydantoin racemase